MLCGPPHSWPPQVRPPHNLPPPPCKAPRSSTHSSLRRCLSSDTSSAPQGTSNPAGSMDTGSEQLCLRASCRWTLRHHTPLIASCADEWTICDLESSIQSSHRPLPARTAQLHGVKVAGDDGSGCKTVSKRPGTSRWAECTAASKYPCRCSSASTTASKTTELARDRSLAMRVLREPPPVRAPCASNAALVTQTNWYSTAVIKQNNPSRSSQKWRPAWRWHLFVAQNDLPGYVPPPPRDGGVGDTG